MTVIISVQLTLALLCASHGGLFTVIVRILNSGFGRYYIAGTWPNAAIVMRINVIETCLAHDQKILVQILYPHRFLFN